jgi:NADH-quinone oxidoreductase subunit G
VGGYLAGCVPGKAGANAHQMLATPARAYILLHAEPTLDCADPQRAAAALNAAEFVVALTAFQPAADLRADVLLPVAPFTETSGSFVNTEGRLQSFNGVVPPLGDSRPAWKVLRVLANLLQLPGFAHNSSEEVRDEILRAGALESRLSNASALDLLPVQMVADAAPSVQFERVSDVPIYFSDALVRHAESLQQTRDARAPGIAMHPVDAERLGLTAGARVRVAVVGAGACELQLGLDQLLAPGAVRVPAAHASTAALGGMTGMLSVERL